MTLIHPAACVDPSANLAYDVEVGPFTVVEPNVEIGPGCKIASHVVIKTGTRLGADNYVEEGAVLGGRPQHLKAGTQTGTLWIGDRNQNREQVTIHTGLAVEDETRIGDDNMIMVNSHIGHDSILGNHCVIVNNVMIAGHVLIEDYAYLAGASAVHQFCRVGAHCMVGGFSRALKDVPPYTMVCGDTSRVMGINRVGLKRRGFQPDDIRAIKEAYRLIYQSNLPWEAMIDELASRYPEGPASAFAQFLSGSKRGWLPERRSTKPASAASETETDPKFPRISRAA